jgi:hypothetical protein
MARLRSLEVTIQPGKVFTLGLYKGAEILAVEERTGQNPRLLIREEASDEYSSRKFVFVEANGDTEIPQAACYVAMAKQGYWFPFALFEVTGCNLDELQGD